MNFKDQLALDLAVFLNPAEFGELVELEGQTVQAVVEDVALGYPQYLVEGLRQRRKCISIASVDAPNMLVIGRVISFEDEEWIVESFTRELGMSTITVSREVY